MGFNDINSVMGRLSRGVGKLSDSEVRLLLFDIFNRLEKLENEEAPRTSGSDPVPGVEDPKPGTGKRGRPRKSDGASSEAGGDA